MLVRSYLKWSSQAPAPERAEAAAIMAHAYLHAQLSPEDRYEAEAALTLALDDPSARVRRTLAEILAAEPGAPPHVVAALAADQSDVGALVLARSPLLRDEQLVDFAAVGDTLAQVAIAMRRALSAPVAAALAETACLEALIVLVRNMGAEIADFSFDRMVARMGSDGAFREALLERPGLPVAIRQQLIGAVAQSLSRFVSARAWVPERRAERLGQGARESATLALGVECDGPDLAMLVAHLRDVGLLTPGLILRALLCGDRRLIVATLAELAQVPFNRAAGIVYERGSSAFTALYRRARMPAALEPAFVAAIASIARRVLARDGAPLRLNRPIIADVLHAVRAMNGADAAALTAMLYRFDAEAARAEARALTADIMASAEPVTMADIAAGLQIQQAPAPEPVAVAPEAAMAEPDAADLLVEPAEIALVPEPGSRLDGDGLAIPFDPDEYALRRAA